MLIDAAEKGDAEKLREILAVGADVNYTRPRPTNESDDDDERQTALFKAACNRHLEVLQILIDAGADVNKARSDEATPLYMASASGYLEIVKALAIAKADVNLCGGTNDWTPLKKAFRNNHTSVVEYLKSVGAQME